MPVRPLLQHSREVMITDILDVNITGGAFAQKGNKNFKAVLLGITPVEILSANIGRKTAFIQNIGKQIAYLAENSALSIGTGFLLRPDESLEDNFSVSAWWGITAKGSTELRIIEVI